MAGNQRGKEKTRRKWKNAKYLLTYRPNGPIQCSSATGPSPTGHGRMEMTKTDSLFSLRAACGVIDSYNFGDNAFVAILRSLKDRGMIKNGYVLQSHLNSVISEFKL